MQMYVKVLIYMRTDKNWQDNRTKIVTLRHENDTVII
jgi:hypothetical protein